MAFYDVVVLYEDAYQEAKAGNDRATYTIKRTLLAKSNTPNPSFVDIAGSETSWPGLGGEPVDQINSLRQFGSLFARCKSRSFGWYSGVENGVKIELTYEGLSPYVNEDSGGSEEPNELESETWRRISLSTSQISVPATDEEGRPFCNAAGDPIDGLEEETSLATLRYTNEFNPDPALNKIWDWLNTCNSEPYLGADPYTLRVTGFSAEFDDGTMLWKTSLELSYNPKTWKITYYNAGLNEIVSDGGAPPTYTRKAILDKSGNPVSQPVPLNENGGQAPIEEPEVVTPEDPNADEFDRFFIMSEAAKLEAKPYPEKDFNEMLQDLRMY